MNKIFRRFLKNYTQGDEEKELWLWNMFYNYEVTIGSVIAIVLCILAYLIIGVFSALGNGMKLFDIRIFLLLVAFALLFGLFAAYFIVSPLLDRDNIRKDNVKQGSFFLATAIGHIANLLINWGPLLVPIISIMRFNWINFIGTCVGVALYYLILGFVKPNAKDYVNWRFNWAIENYELLFSRHYKWWTSAADMSVQKHNLKKFQNYKYHATLSLIMIPLIFLMMLFAGSQSIGEKNKTSQVQVTTDSISTPDVVENTMIDEESNVEAEQYESTEPEEYMSQDEDMIDDNQYSEYDDYEESPSQPTTPSNNSAASQLETKPRTEPVTRTSAQTSTPSAAQAREERQAAQTPKANAGPEFQGGNYALTSYIARHLNYPAAAMEKKIQGKVVVKLTISPTGQVSNAEIVQSADVLLDAEALRLAKSLPRFTPARRNGQPVQSTMTIPINFRL